MTTSTPSPSTTPIPTPIPTPAPAQPAAKTVAAGTAPVAVASKVKKPAVTETKPVAKAPAKPVKRAAVTTTAKAKPAAPAPALPAKEARGKKPKLVRDSFTIPKDEYSVIETLKKRADSLAQPAKKSELLRAGLKVLAGLSDAALRTALQAVPSIKTGRPTKAEVPATKTAAKATRK
nr:hypothetical protein [Acidovorax sp. JG5]